jgi:hypothetical protein
MVVRRLDVKAPIAALALSAVVVASTASAREDDEQTQQQTASSGVADHGSTSFSGAIRQTPPSSNGIYLELGGAGLIDSLNYERRFGDFVGRVGFGGMMLAQAVKGSSGLGGGGTTTTYILALPLTVQYVAVGSERHMLELGAGATPFHTFSDPGVPTNDRYGVFGDAIVGYRFVNYSDDLTRTHFLFRTGLNVIMGLNARLPVLPLPYLSFGANFG